MKPNTCLFAAIALAAAAATASSATACSRVMWQDANHKVVVARNMDWPTDMQSRLWIFPRGIARTGSGSGTFSWTSQYGSVVISSFDVGVSDGMNEKGLVANALWLDESSYAACSTKTPGLSLGLWVQYMLDEFATVKDAVAAIRSGAFQVEGGKLPDGTETTMHLAIADASGDSAIVEIVNHGEVHIYDTGKPAVMTNSPPYPDQLINLHNYLGFGGRWPLPGTSESDDRFVRATYLQKSLPASERDSALDTVFKIRMVMNNVAHPVSAQTSNSPSSSMTRWRSIADLTDTLYFVEPTFHTAMIWVDLSKADFRPGSGTRVIDLPNDATLVDLHGDVTGKFVPRESFKFLPSPCHKP